MIVDNNSDVFAVTKVQVRINFPSANNEANRPFPIVLEDIGHQSMRRRQQIK